MTDLTPQPKALELAASAHLGYRVGWQREAAAELRRQHAEIEALQSLIRDEIDEGLRLRTLGGAGPDENITAMTERVIAERDSLRAEVEREREARKAAQIRQAELTDEVVRLEPMRQRAAYIERLTAEVERLRADSERYRWLKERPYGWSVLHEKDGWATCYGRGELDAKIDAAREAKG